METVLSYWHHTRGQHNGEQHCELTCCLMTSSAHLNKMSVSRRWHQTQCSFFFFLLFCAVWFDFSNPSEQSGAKFSKTAWVDFCVELVLSCLMGFYLFVPWCHIPDSTPSSISHPSLRSTFRWVTTLILMHQRVVPHQSLLNCLVKQLLTYWSEPGYLLDNMSPKSSWWGAIGIDFNRLNYFRWHMYVHFLKELVVFVKCPCLYESKWNSAVLVMSTWLAD